jgi:ketosteroid isomerase-like protein
LKTIARTLKKRSSTVFHSESVNESEETVMTQENLETTRRLFQAVEERNIAGVVAAYAPNVVIRDSASLPYGGIYHGLEGAKQHVERAAQAWMDLQPPEERKMDAVFLEAGEYVIALWRLKGRDVSSGRTLDSPTVSVYKLQNAKIVDSQMFYSDTSAISAFLRNSEGTVQFLAGDS